MKIENYNINIGNATDVGKIRQYNEDYLAHFSTSSGYCVIVCDGMGGHAAGDVASQAAVEAIKHYLQDGTITKLDTPDSLLNAIEFANYRLREMVEQKPALAGMGTTCVIALFNNNEMYAAHAGDSRLYLIRNKEIKQISKDHSTVQQLIDAGAMSEEEAKQSNKRNQITKAIGIFEKVEPSISQTPILLKPYDKILLCTDGLTTHLEDKEIRKIISLNEDVQTAALKLTESANANGGSDNITVQLVEFTGESNKNRNKHPGRSVLKVVFALLVVALGVFSYKYFKPEKLIKKNNQINFDSLPKVNRSLVADSSNANPVKPEVKTYKNNEINKNSKQNSEKVRSE